MKTTRQKRYRMVLKRQQGEKENNIRRRRIEKHKERSSIRHVMRDWAQYLQEKISRGENEKGIRRRSKKYKRRSNLRHVVRAYARYLRERNYSTSSSESSDDDLEEEEITKIDTTGNPTNDEDEKMNQLRRRRRQMYAKASSTFRYVVRTDLWAHYLWENVSSASSSESSDDLEKDGNESSVIIISDSDEKISKIDTTRNPTNDSNECKEYDANDEKKVNDAEKSQEFTINESDLRTTFPKKVLNSPCKDVKEIMERFDLSSAKAFTPS